MEEMKLPKKEKEKKLSKLIVPFQNLITCSLENT